jgi:hypothetical protein
MHAQVMDWFEDGLLSQPEGKFISLPPFSESWAFLNYYDGVPTFQSPTNFVVTAELSLESASDTANWFASGCGFIFGDVDRDHHYLAVFTMDGYANLARFQDGEVIFLQKQYYGRVDFPDERIQFTLIVDGQIIMIYVNGERLVREAEPAAQEGMLSYALVSGTNKDFGTRCNLEKVELWELSD